MSWHSLYIFLCFLAKIKITSARKIITGLFILVNVNRVRLLSAC